MTEVITIHAFEKSGLGRAPFKCVGVAQIPPASLAESNPTAYQYGLSMLPRGYHCGTCSFCGMAIMANYLIESADGQKFSVGCDCVAKTGDLGLIKIVNDEAAKLRREKARERAAAKREARRIAWLADNKERLEAEAAAKAQREVEKAAEREAVKGQWAFIVPMLLGREGFCGSICNSIQAGDAPRGRAIDILREMWAKRAGRANSKAYFAAVEDFNLKIGA